VEVFARPWLQRKGRTIAIDAAIIDYSLFHVCLSHGEYDPRRLGDRSHHELGSDGRKTHLENLESIADTLRDMADQQQKGVPFSEAQVTFIN
jgi:hypothetical protein